MDNHTPEQRHKNMQAIRNKDTNIELILRKGLWSRGVRYRKNVKDVFGHPDIAIKKYKLAIFCDSEFWHGYDWDNRKNDFKSNTEFWIAKIERNIQRDNEVNQHLTNEGWTVIRFWGKEIKKSTDACVTSVVSVINGEQSVEIGRVYNGKEITEE